MMNTKLGVKKNPTSLSIPDTSTRLVQNQVSHRQYKLVCMIVSMKTTPFINFLVFTDMKISNAS